MASIFAEAFDHLCLRYRSEYVYKSAIADRIVFGRHSPSTSSMAIELGVGRSIVDVAVFNGTSTAYEIKTEFDTPRRLVTQTCDYLKAFDRVFIVTHAECAETYLSATDERVGVLSLNGKGSLRTLREATPNTSGIDRKTIFGMLRRDEYRPALELALGCEINLPNGIVGRYCEKAFCDLSHNDAHAIYLTSMRARTTDGATASFISSLPKHLRVLGYAQPLSSPQRRNFQQVLQQASVSF